MVVFEDSGRVGPFVVSDTLFVSGTIDAFCLVCGILFVGFNLAALMIFLEVILYLSLLILLLYIVRHFVFALNRLFVPQRAPYIGLDLMPLPTVTVLVPAHNEEAVIGGCLEALLRQDYPQEKFLIIPCNDRSKDRTREIIDAYVEKNPGRIEPFHRVGGKPGKAAALKEICQRVRTDLIVVFDADYLPSRALLRNIVAPFLDPEVGGVMGRVVPMNAHRNLLTRMLDLERSGGYQVDQQARMNLGLVPQYGGTVGGLRRVALEQIGGWNENILAEDTDVTLRLYLAGWSVVYQNACECYEEVPEAWPVRIRQIKRWAKGHNHVFLNELGSLLKSPHLGWRRKLDGALLLGIYFVAPLSLVAWILSLVLFLNGGGHGTLAAIYLLPVLMFSALGNFGLYLEVSAAVLIDNFKERVRLLPLGLLFFFTSLFVITESLLRQMLWEIPTKKGLVWDKTTRYRGRDS